MIAPHRPWTALARTALVAIAGVGALASGAIVYAAAPEAGDAAKGAEVFEQCALCHSDAPGVNQIGPSLAGVVGRRVATAPGFDYSDALKASDVVWTPAQLDRFLAKPAAAIPGNRMTFSGVHDAEERANLIAFLAKTKG